MMQRLVACGVAGAAKLCVPHGLAIAGLFLLWIVELCVLIYTAVRLVYFLPAVVVAEKRIGLGRSWSLGGGNFWRIFVVCLASLVPVAIIIGIVSHLTVDPVVKAQLLALPKPPGGHHVPFQARLATFHAQLSIWPLVLAINAVQRIVFSGLTTGAIGAAYKAVTTTKE